MFAGKHGRYIDDGLQTLDDLPMRINFTAMRFVALHLILLFVFSITAQSQQENSAENHSVASTGNVLDRSKNVPNEAD